MLPVIVVHVDLNVVQLLQVDVERYIQFIPNYFLRLSNTKIFMTSMTEEGLNNLQWDMRSNKSNKDTLISPIIEIRSHSLGTLY